MLEVREKKLIGIVVNIYLYIPSHNAFSKSSSLEEALEKPLKNPSNTVFRVFTQRKSI